MSDTGYLIIGVFGDSDGDGVKSPKDSPGGEREVIAKVGGERFTTDALTGTTKPIPLPPGNYFPTRTSFPRGYRSTTLGNKAVVEAGKTTTFWIGSTNLPAGSVAPTPPTPEPTGSISGQVFNDHNADSKFNAGDGVGKYVTVYLDIDNDQVLDQGEPFTKADERGKFTFQGLADGTYWVRVEGDQQRISTLPVQVTIRKGAAVKNIQIGIKDKLVETPPVLPPVVEPEPDPVDDGKDNEPVDPPPVSEMIKSIGGLDEGKYELIYPLAKQMGLGSLRVWINSNNYTFVESMVSTRVTRAVAMAKALGVVPFFTVAQSDLKPGTFNDQKVKAFVKGLHAYIRKQLNDAGLTKVPVRLQWGNEPNLVGNYWLGANNETDNLTLFIEAVGRPFAEAAREVGAYLIGPAISWNYNLLRLKAADILKYADCLAYHPYPQNSTDTPRDVTGFYKIGHAAETAKSHGVDLILSEAQMKRGQEYKAARAKGGQTQADSLKKISGEIKLMWAAAKKYGVKEYCIFHGWDIDSQNSAMAAFLYTTDKGVKNKVWGSEYFQLYCDLV